MLTSEEPVTQGLKQITVRSAVQVATDALRSAIIDGTLKPGERLVEQKLASKLGIGQPTLREALKQLEYEGFVRKTAQKGTYVTELTKDDYRKILEVRVALESLAVASAARTMSSESLSELERLVNDMRSSTASGDLAKFHNLDLKFHRKIWEAAGNEYLIRALDTVTSQLFAFALSDLGSDLARTRPQAVAQHATILEGLRTRDPEIARRRFVSCTLEYWANIHHVTLNQEAFIPASSAFRIATSSE